MRKIAAGLVLPWSKVAEQTAAIARRQQILKIAQTRCEERGLRIKRHLAARMRTRGCHGTNRRRAEQVETTATATAVGDAQPGAAGWPLPVGKQRCLNATI
jgi:hypothetical protein